MGSRTLYVVILFVIFKLIPARAQPLSPRIEKKVTNEVNGFLSSLNSNSCIDSGLTLTSYSQCLMNDTKDYQTDSPNTGNENSIMYSKEIKGNKQRIRIFIHFAKPFVDITPIKYVVSFSISQPLPLKYFDSLITTSLDKANWTKIGTNCYGGIIFFNKSKKGYIEYSDNFLRGQTILFYPSGYITSFNSHNFPIEESIIYDSLPRLPEYRVIYNKLTANPHFTRTTQNSNVSTFDFSFYNVIQNDLSNYIRDDSVMGIIDSKEKIISIRDSLIREKKQSLNLEWFSVTISRDRSITDNFTNSIGISILIQDSSFNYSEELQHISEALYLMLALSELLDLFPQINSVLEKMKLEFKDEITQYSLPVDNYQITTHIAKITQDSKMCYFLIELKPCAIDF